MKVNWLRLIRNQLLIAIRKERLVELIRVMISPAIKVHGDWLIYEDKTRLYGAATGQLCWLELLLQMELSNGSVSITEGDGLPVDFLVTHDGNLSDVRLKALLDAFKVAGKSYAINNADVTYSVSWLDGVCEKTELVESSASWLDGVCEKREVPFYICDSLGERVGGVITIAREGGIAGLRTPLYVVYPSEPITVKSVSGGLHTIVLMSLPVSSNKRRLKTVTNYDYQHMSIWVFTSGGYELELRIEQDGPMGPG